MCLCLCSVESSDVNWKRKKSAGIKIICQSEMRDFSAMAFITDHVNSLIEQWFPGQCTDLCLCGHSNPAAGSSRSALTIVFFVQRRVRAILGLKKEEIENSE